MKLFLNMTLKGLLVALLIVTLGGFLYINVIAPDEINLKLISSSLVNQVGTSASNIQTGKKQDNSKILVENNKEEKETEENTESKEEQQDDTKEVENEVKETDKENEVNNNSNTETNNSSDTNKDNNSNSNAIVNNDNSNNNNNNSNNNNTTNDNNSNNNIENNNSNNNVNNEEVIEATPAPEVSGYAPNLEAVNSSSVITTYNGPMTAYGPDCAGCGGMVAHGEYVGEGNIYYNDATFGRIRIVAGDWSLPFGTVVRITGIAGSPIIAIVLDRGGAISFNNIYFDLLYESEQAASSFGRPYATFEILRSGF